MQINVEKIKDLIGPGGKTIKELVATYNVKINADDDGKVSIAAANKEIGEKRHRQNRRVDRLAGSQPDLQRQDHPHRGLRTLR